LEAVPEQVEIRCSYCGTINEPTVMPSPEPESFQGVSRPTLRVSGRSLGWFVGTMVLVPLLGALAGIAAAVYGVWMSFRVGREASRVPLVRQLTTLTVADLPRLHETGRKPLDVGAPPGGYGGFDGLEQLPWAAAIARAWSQDARIDRVDLHHVHPDGVVDAAADPEAEVLYRFKSPARIAGFWQDADTHGKRDCECEFWVVAKQGQTAVQLITGRPSEGTLPPPPVAALTVRKLFERARSRLPGKPLYDAYLIYEGRSGWVWYLQTLSHRDNIPQFRASDGRPWPW
jgi:hypothetical protein